MIDRPFRRIRWSLIGLCLWFVPVAQAAEAGQGSSDQGQPTLDQLLNLADPHEAGQPQQLLVDRSAAPAAGSGLQVAVAEMELASVQLQQNVDAGIQTQRLQASVLRRLDGLIAEARQSPGRGAAGSRSEPRPTENGSRANLPRGEAAGSTTGQASNGAFSPGGVGPQQAAGEAARVGQQWGDLSPRLRRQLTQSMQEPFSQIYQAMTEAYYRRLAQMGGR